jgi:hypothetical protein
MIDQKQKDNVEYFKYLGSMITNDARCACEIISRIAKATTAFNKKKILFTSGMELNSKKKIVKCYIWRITLYGAETRTLQRFYLKYQESFEMFRWCRTATIIWTDYVRNEEVLQSQKRRGISCNPQKERSLTGRRTAF